MIRHLVALLAFTFLLQNLHAQELLTPGMNVFDRKFLKPGRAEMGYYYNSNGNLVQICDFTIDIRTNERELIIYTGLHFLNGDRSWLDTIVNDVKNFQPIYRASYSKDKDFVLRYGKEVTGYYFDKKNQQRTSIREAPGSTYFDSYTYPYLIGLLPLTTGYRGEISVYDYNPGNSSNIKKARIEEVRNNLFRSELTGEHKVWQVNILEANGDRYQYLIDKETRKIWKIDIFSKSQHLVMIDKEIDYNPFKTVFNKEQTMKLVTDGKSVIKGEVFARDNENEGMIRGMAVLNINKKQVAPEGTSVVLIPYTDYFKEWIRLNEATRKKGRAVPLSQAAAECIKITTVYDKEGHFEFVNLMPGEYLLYTEFGFVHTSRRSEVVGYTDTYINGMFQGSTANTQVRSYGVNSSATIKKVVTIDKDGETVSVKLKKTR